MIATACSEAFQIIARSLTSPHGLWPSTGSDASASVTCVQHVDNVGFFTQLCLQGKPTGKWARQNPAGRIQTLLLPVKHGSNGLNLTGR